MISMEPLPSRSVTAGEAYQPVMHQELHPPRSQSSSGGPRSAVTGTTAADMMTINGSINVSLMAKSPLRELHSIVPGFALRCLMKPVRSFLNVPLS